MTDKLLFNAVYTSLWLSPSKQRELCKLPAGSILIDEGEQGNGFSKVTFRTDQDFTGWVRTYVLDEVVNALPQDIVELPEQTRTLQDLKQYVKMFGVIQRNCCGEICVAFITSNPLAVLLEKWKQLVPNIFKRAFPSLLSVPTGTPELISLLRLCDNVDEIVYLSTAFHDPENGRMVLTPARLAKWVGNNWKIIIGVSIDNKGKLVAKGTRHWVTITRVDPADVMDGLVYFYNPATNGVQFKAWDDFMASVGAPVGLLVQTKA